MASLVHEGALVERTDAAGRLCVNNYAFLAHLGAGAWGDVALCRDTASPDGTPALVAVKAFSKSRLLRQREVRRPRGGGDAAVVTALSRVLAEVAVMTALARGGGHPCVAALRAVLSGAGSDDLYLVMDYVDGGQPVRLCDGSRPGDAAHVRRVRAALQPPPLPRPPPVAPSRSDSTACFAALGDGVDIAPSASSHLGGRARMRGHDDDDDGDDEYGQQLSVFVSCAQLSPSAGAAPAVPPGGPAPLPLAAARQVAHDVLRALAHAHARLVAHRDVKPENILLSSQGGGCAVLCDWGSAELFEDTGTAADGGGRPVDWVTDTAGTYAFLPPEACSDPAAALATGDDAPLQPGGEDDKGGGGGGSGGYSAFAADAWAVGVSLHVLLFGVLPFGRRARGAWELFEAVHLESLHPLPLALAREPQACGGDALLADLLSGLLAKDARARLSVGAALAHPWFAAIASPASPRVGFLPLDTSLLPPYRTPAMAVLEVQQQQQQQQSRQGGALQPGDGDDGACAREAAPPVGMHDDPTEGWLWKRTRWPGLWRRRWFAWRHGELRYCHAQGAAHAAGTGSKHVQLAHAALPACGTSRGAPLELLLPLAGGRHLRLRASCAADAESWALALGPMRLFAGAR